MTSKDSVREDIAFIRHAIEQGRGYAGAHSFDLLVWGIRPRDGLSRHLCDRHRMVASQSKLAVGRLHRPAMALLATPTAAFPPVPLAADCDPAARDPGAADAVVRLRYFPVAIFSRGDRCGRQASGLVQ